MDVKPIRVDWVRSLREARFRRRPNRFIIEAELDGFSVEAHLPDPGRLSELLIEGAQLWLEPAPPSSERRTRWSARIVRAANETLVSLDPLVANRLLRRCLETNSLPGFQSAVVVAAEPRYDGGRFDFKIEMEGAEILVEAKSVTLAKGVLGLFPDAPTARGLRHLQALDDLAIAGRRALLVFVAQREDVDEIRPARDIDPAFADALEEADQHGVDLLGLSCRVDPQGLRLLRRIPVYSTR